MVDKTSSAEQRYLVYKLKTGSWRGRIWRTTHLPPDDQIEYPIWDVVATSVLAAKRGIVALHKGRSRMVNRAIVATALIRKGDPTAKWAPGNDNPCEQRQLLLLLDDLPRHDLERLARAGINGEKAAVVFWLPQLELPIEGEAGESQEYQGFRVGEAVRTSHNGIGIIQDISCRDRRNPVLMVRLEQGLGDIVPMLPADLEHIAQ
jgi:hypothetical protein